MRAQVVAAVLLAAATVAEGQLWQEAPPAITVTAHLVPIRQFRSGTEVHLSFGTDGVMPGVTKTIAPLANDTATGTAARVDVRYNVGTKIAVTGSPLMATIDTATFSITPAYTCAIADDQNGTNLVAFPGPCTAGYEWESSTVTGMNVRSILVGAELAGAETDSKPAGVYLGTLTLVLSSSSS